MNIPLFRSNAMTQPEAWPATPIVPTFWRIPLLFLRDTLMNTVMFFALGIAAFLVEWLVQWLEIWGLKGAPVVLLQGTSYVLLVSDVIIFCAIQVFLVYHMLNHLRRLRVHYACP
jgi:hypothetical protein